MAKSGRQRYNPNLVLSRVSPNLSNPAMLMTTVRNETISSSERSRDRQITKRGIQYGNFISSVVGTELVFFDEYIDGMGERQNVDPSKIPWDTYSSHRAILPKSCFVWMVKWSWLTPSEEHDQILYCPSSHEKIYHHAKSKFVIVQLYHWLQFSLRDLSKLKMTTRTTHMIKLSYFHFRKSTYDWKMWKDNTRNVKAFSLHMKGAQFLRYRSSK
jgi:hypothetical protein